MIAWMLYAMLVSAALGGAALLAERSFRLHRRPVRWLWVGAVAASAVLPIAARVFRAAPAAAPVRGTAVVWQGPVHVMEGVGAATVSLETVLVLAWLAVSVVLLVWAMWTWGRLRRERRSWAVQIVEGVEVLVSPDVGPAVIDPLAGGIVVPEWLLRVPSAQRRMALEHELEHLRAHDHRMVWIARLVAIAFPWNAALWWQLHRLKNAIELDCDRRVLARGVSPKAYAELLLSVGAVSWGRRVQPALTEPHSFLWWRIGAMIDPRVRFRIIRSVAYGAVAGGLLFVACDVPTPQEGEPTAVTAAQEAPVYAEEAAGVQRPERLSCPALPYPAELKDAGVTGMVMLQFVVETDGSVKPQSIQTTESTDHGFEGPAREMVTGCRFRPGRLEGEAIRTLVHMPIYFTLAGSRTVRAEVPTRAPDQDLSVEISTVRPSVAPTGAVHGMVYDPPGRPLADATVTMVGTKFTATTAADGSFELPSVPAGTYEMKVEYRGYATTRVNPVRVLADQSLQVNFRMAEEGGR